MAPEALVALGALIVAVPVGLGLLVSSWPRPDTRLGKAKNRAHPSLTEMVMRDEGDAL